MRKILKKDDLDEESNETNEYQLSVFDFFREMILAQFYSQANTQRVINKSATASQRIQKSGQGDIIMRKMSQAFSKYAQTGESFELVDGEYLRIHDAELSQLMRSFMR